VRRPAGNLDSGTVDDPEPVRAALAQHRIKAAFRGTAIRFSTHVYNDAADIERAATFIGPLQRAPSAIRADGG
jgi:selenocysteine lyase/cysteine desulfurase